MLGKNSNDRNILAHHYGLDSRLVLNNDLINDKFIIKENDIIIEENANGINFGFIK